LRREEQLSDVCRENEAFRETVECLKREGDQMRAYVRVNSLFFVDEADRAASRGPSSSSPLSPVAQQPLQSLGIDVTSVGHLEDPGGSIPIFSHTRVLIVRKATGRSAPTVSRRPVVIHPAVCNAGGPPGGNPGGVVDSRDLDGAI